ncbi:conserved hypothetical protein domain [Diplonema papillatum]|nr:conserved hypothetical protein domain [Diplonema papillatum]
MGNGAARGATATEELDTTGQPQYVADEHAMSSPKSQVGCSSAKGVVMKPMLSLDMNSVNSRNAFLAENRHEIEVSGKPKLYRVPNSDAMEPGDKKLIKCGGRTIAVFKLEDQWAAMDNACYHHGGPLFMGDIEEYNSQTCIVCPWHCTKIALDTGVSLYESVDVKRSLHTPQAKVGGPRQRIHQVFVRGDDVLIRLNPADEYAYASDRYATIDIASNDEARMDPDAVDSESSGKERMQELIRNRKRSMRAERERKRNPTRIPAGQLTPRGKDAGPYVPDWVRKGELPPSEDDYADDDWSPAYDLADEFRDLEGEYERRRELCEKAKGASSE